MSPKCGDMETREGKGLGQSLKEVENDENREKIEILKILKNFTALSELNGYENRTFQSLMGSLPVVN